MVNLHYRF